MDNNGSGTAVATPETDQPELIREERPATTKMSLGSDHERKITREAFEHRAVELDKLAKKTSDEGYAKLSRIIGGDASLIRYELLPQVRPSQMQLAEGAGLRSGLVALVEPTIRGGLPTLVDPEKWKREEASSDIADTLADRLLKYVTHVAEVAWTAGFNARDTEPEQVAFRCLETYDKPAGAEI